MQVTPAYLSSVASFYDHAQRGARRPAPVYVCTGVACMPQRPEARASRRSRRRAASRTSRTPRSASSSASARATWRRWRRSTAATSARSTRADAPAIVAGDQGRREAAARPRARGLRLPAALGRSRVGMLTELRMLNNIDVPGLNEREVYERLGGYRALRKALARDVRGRGSHGARGARACAAAAAPASRWARRRASSPRATMDKYLCCNADESEPGTFKDRLLMQRNPHKLIEGIIIAAKAAGANKAFIYIRGEYSLQADILDRAVAEAYEAGYLGDEHPRHRLRPRPRRAPRRRRVHLRRGDGAARLARGQARQPAPQAAVPRQPGPLPGARR